MNTEVFLFGKRDSIPFRFSVFFLTSLVTIMASNNFGFFYEMVTHPSPPYFHDVQILIVF